MRSSIVRVVKEWDPKYEIRYFCIRDDLIMLFHMFDLFFLSFYGLASE
jgi:hypothetical protein